MAAKFGTHLRAVTLISGLALMATPAFAQAPSPANGPGGSMTTTNTPPRQRAPMPDPTKSEDVSKITGASVYDSSDAKIGSVSTVLMQPQTKTIDRFVIHEGGVLGVGGRHVAMPVDAFSWDAEKGGFKIAKSADDLKSMPEWKSPEVAQTPERGTTRPRGSGGM